MARRRGPERLDIVYEDASLIVLNKPPGLLTVPLARRENAASVSGQLEQYFRSHGKRRPFVVHRIDRDTSGLVVFAKDARTQSALRAQFERRDPERIYLAVVVGHPDPKTGTWRDHLAWDARQLIQKETSARDPRGVEAVSEYRVVESFEDASLVEVRLRTGKRNQIRIQAALRGHPLIGEQQYIDEKTPPSAIDFPRQALHAWRLGFSHPADRRPLRFEAPLPPDLSDLLAYLRGHRG